MPLEADLQPVPNVHPDTPLLPGGFHRCEQKLNLRGTELCSLAGFLQAGPMALLHPHAVSFGEQKPFSFVTNLDPPAARQGGLKALQQEEGKLYFLPGGARRLPVNLNAALAPQPLNLSLIHISEPTRPY